MCSKIELNHAYPKRAPSEAPTRNRFEISNKTGQVALLAFAALTAWYKFPIFCLGLGSYAVYKGVNFAIQENFAPGSADLFHFHPSDLRLSESKPAAVKLSQELSRAKKHQDKQKSRGFYSRSFVSLSQQPCAFEIHSLKETLPALHVGVAHAQGMRPSQEDLHIACSGRIGTANPLQYDLFGIVDGHGGDATSNFVGAHINEEIEKALLKHGSTESGIRKALKEAFVQLDARIICEVGEASGAAAVISLKIGSSLWTANLGDSRAVLKVGNRTIQLSEDAKPDAPRFKKSIEKRGGWVELVHGVPRINGVLAVARSFGDKTLRGRDGYYVVSPRPKITKVDLTAYQGRPIYLIQACDGIWDVASSEEVASIIGMHSPEKDATAIVRAALNAGSTDNCSALVTRLA